MMLVSMSTARMHIRSDSNADDLDLQLKIEAASEAILTHLGDAAEAWTDSAGFPFLDTAGVAVGVPQRVQQATLMLIGYMYKERDGSNEYAVPSQYGFGYFPIGVEAFLFPARKPVVS